MKAHLYSCFLFLSVLKAGAQLYPNYNRYQRMYPLVNHITQHGFMNILYGKERENAFSYESGAFKSYIPEFLAQKELAGKTLKASAVKMKNNYYFFYAAAEHLPEIDGRLLDSLFSGEKVIETTDLHYDASGCLVKRVQLDQEYPKSTSKDTMWLSYARNGDSSSITMVSKEWQRNKDGGYSSIYAGDFKTGAVVITTSARSVYHFNAKGLISSTAGHYERYANGRKDFKASASCATYTWNEKGLLLDSRDSIEERGAAIVKHFTYREAPFNLEKEQENFAILKTPAIKRWLKKFSPDSLSMLYFTGGSEYDTDRPGVYIMRNKLVPLMRLENPEPRYEQMYSEIHERWQDSSGVSLLHYWITQLPDVNDSIPYRPPGKNDINLMPYPYNHQRPPGLIDVHSVSLVNYQEVTFKSGWKALVRRTGSSGSAKAALGFPPPIWPDPQYTEFIFVDPFGAPRFFYENQRLYKLVY